MPSRALPPALAVALSLLTHLAVHAAPAPDPLEAIESQTGSVIELRAETVRLESAWQTDRELLESTIAALEDRTTRAEEDLVAARAATAKEREEIDDLEARTRAATENQKTLESRLAESGTRLLQLRASLPPRLSDALDVSFRSLAGSDLGPGERLQLTVSVLNRCAQFNRMVSFGEEILVMEPGAEPRMFEVIYWGLSHGYALDRAAGQAWYGAPASEGWRWESRPELLAPTLDLIAIYTDKRDPEFVVAPARLVDRPAATTTSPAP